MELLEKLFSKNHTQPNTKKLHTIAEQVNVLKDADMVRVGGGRSNKNLQKLTAWDMPCTVLPYQ